MGDAPVFRDGKAVVAREVAEILDRLGTTADQWHSGLEELRRGRFLSRFFATSRARLHEVAEKLGVRRVPNVSGCPTA